MPDDYEPREDPRSVAEMKAESPWQEGIITRATGSEDGGWTIEWDQKRERYPDGRVEDQDLGSYGCGFRADRNPKGIRPQEGDTMRMYGDGFGSSFYGIDINGVEVFFRTPLEREADRVVSLAASDRRDREQFEQQREDLDRRVAALPPEFRERIERRRANNPTFRMRFEPYELFCCEQAIAFAEAAREAVKDGEPEEVTAFWVDGGPWTEAYPKNPAGEEDDYGPAEDPAVRWLYWWNALGNQWGDYNVKLQHELMPAFSNEHSGNTYGAALTLASLWLRAPDKVGLQYGALAPLVGSEDYGDVDPKKNGEPDLVGEQDAMKWAQEFVRIVKENPAIATDEGTMVGWFANAIESGKSHAAA